MHSANCNLFAGGGFEILQDLPKCDREPQSEVMLLEKWWWNTCSTCSTHGWYKPLIYKNEMSAKCS